MVDGDLSFSDVHAAYYVAVCYSHMHLYVYNNFCLTYFANTFRLCVASFSLTISGILLTVSSRLYLRHFIANPCRVLKVYNSFFYSGVVCMYVILVDRQMHQV